MNQPPPPPPFMPPMMGLAPPPLPAGWTEHLSPSGQAYYFHAATNESTYTRPLPPMPSFPLPLPPSSNQPPIDQKHKKQKKDKPLYKIPVPDTNWLRVKTVSGNIFWTHAERKESVWEVPEEIKTIVEELDWSTLERAADEEKEAKERDKETARAVSDMMAQIESGKRKAEELENVAAAKKARIEKKKKKAAAMEDQALNEIEITVDTPMADGQDDDEDDADGNESEASAAFSNSEAEAEWQREMAEDMAALAAEEEVKKNAPPPAPEELKEPETPVPDPSAFPVPAQASLSAEEAKALFKTLLTEKKPSHLAPFASIMPLLITDPRYVLLPSQNDRENVFNEWCRDIARANRLAKGQAALHPSVTEGVEGEGDGTATTESQHVLSKEEEKQRARETYDALLKEDVKSTRTTWDEFRRKWKKDRRFFGFGRDEREREKVFKAWLKDLGERKRAQAQKAEMEFMAMLKSNASTLPITPESQWKDVKRSLVKDPRYDAVGSSSLREELFGTFLKALSPNAESTETPAPPPQEPESTTNTTKEDRKARAERGLREREDKVRAERGRIDRDIGKSKQVLGSAGAETELMSFYVDAVRDPLASWHDILPTLSAHPRFTSIRLPQAQKQHLFDQHVSHITRKHRTNLDALFLQYAPSLATTFSSLPESSIRSLESSLPGKTLGLRGNDRSMERVFDDWMRIRTTRAREDFQKLLEENSFVEFWGKVGKIDAGGAEGGTLVPGEDDGEGEGGEEAGGKADLKALAKGIGGTEVERVLKHDQRYRAFDHVPEQRARWVKDYLSGLSAPKLSVHVPDHV